MKIFSAAQIKACDAYTIQHAGITSIDLMERAATRCVSWLQDNLPKDSLFVILCGTGNNGGDGLAIARLLHRSGYGVKAFLLRLSKELSSDCQTNLDRLSSIDKDLVTTVEPGTFITDIPRNIILVDAIFGTGLNRALSGWAEEFIKHLNTLPNTRIAIDIPTGLLADAVPAASDTVLKAHHTLSFQFHKRSFLHAESAPFIGTTHILDIGLDQGYIHRAGTTYHTIGQAYVSSLYKPRQAFAHKGNYGSVLLAGGSYGKIGAMVLTAKAALRAGAGLVTTLIPACGYSIMQTAVPEAMCIVNGEEALNDLSHNSTFSTVGLGPGMGTNAGTALAFTSYIAESRKPLVIDADALNIISAQPELLSQVPKNSVLTPHPKEFARLFGDNTNSMVQVDNARMQAMRYGLNIVLKGRHTAVINADGECRYNMTGNPGMATGGSGDVLTGIITALIAQGYEPYNAALLGVYIHGLAGDLAAAATSQEAMIASDIIAFLGAAFRTLK